MNYVFMRSESKDEGIQLAVARRVESLVRSNHLYFCKVWIDVVTQYWGAARGHTNEVGKQIREDNDMLRAYDYVGLMRKESDLLRARCEVYERATSNDNTTTEEEVATEDDGRRKRKREEEKGDDGSRTLRLRK